jgi:hypothetical protein
VSVCSVAQSSSNQQASSSGAGDPEDAVRSSDQSSSHPVFRDGRPCGSYLFVALMGEGCTSTCFVVQNANTLELCVLKVRPGCLLELSRSQVESARPWPKPWRSFARKGKLRHVATSSASASSTAMWKLRIALLKIRVGDELTTRPFRDARRFPSPGS